MGQVICSTRHPVEPFFWMSSRIFFYWTSSSRKIASVLLVYCKTLCFYCCRNFLDTLLFADFELAHVVSPFQPIDDCSHSHRDMGIFFTRRLSKKEEANDDVCFLFDGEEAHQELPCSFTINSKYLQAPKPSFTGAPFG